MCINSFCVPTSQCSNPGTCNNFSPCGTSETCVCAGIVEGNHVCVSNTTEPATPRFCFNSTGCDVGQVCVANTCLGSVCLDVVCQCPNGQPLCGSGDTAACVSTYLTHTPKLSLIHIINTNLASSTSVLTARIVYQVPAHAQMDNHHAGLAILSLA